MRDGEAIRSDAGGFTGWIRTPGGPWQAVVGDQRHDECLTLLLIHAAAVLELHKDLTVLPSGEDPNRRPPRHALEVAAPTGREK
jgi:hypothetical protein